MASRRGNKTDGSNHSNSFFQHSNARGVAKRRDKPFKADQISIQNNKKLNTRVSYTGAPPGYVFVPLGTPDLAELCKELSRQRDYPVNIVHAKPASRMVLDPGKVSHHIQRIGYHFRSEVVEEACSQLQYMIVNGKFYTAADIKKQQKESFLAQVMAKYGLRSVSEASKETPEQVSAVIKELFPAIPDKDLSDIVEHAWAEGTQRVGTVAELELSRRVQLAVIARIRHHYTDYDRLLKAFDWRHARSEVEADCLKKLIEWRGDELEDNGLEEIVRETIVIDDDAPRLKQNVQRDFTPGDASDTSIEIVHRAAVADDLRAEDPREQEHRYFQAQGLTQQRSIAERNDIARAKIDAIRDQMRAQRPPLGGYMLPTRSPAEEVVGRVTIDARNPRPNEIVVNGVVMRRASPEPPIYAHQSKSRPLPQLPYAHPQQPTAAYRQQDIPVPSIEQRKGDLHQRMPSDPRALSTLFAPAAVHHQTHSPRHGEPAYLQYQHLNSSLPQTRTQQRPQQPFNSAHSAPQQRPQEPFNSAYSAPQHPTQLWASQAPLPPVPVAQPQRATQQWPTQLPLPSALSLQQPQQSYTSHAGQTMMMPTTLQPDVPAFLQYPSIPRPVHGAPAPVQPAPSSSSYEPYVPQYRYGQ